MFFALRSAHVSQFRPVAKPGGGTDISDIKMMVIFSLPLLSCIDRTSIEMNRISSFTAMAQVGSRHPLAESNEHC